MGKNRSFFISPNFTRHIILLVLAIGLGLSLYAFHAWRNLEAAEARAQFAKDGADHMVIARANVLKAAVATGYLGTVFEAAGNLDHLGFDYFAQKVLKNNPVVQELAWLPIVRPDDRAAIELQAAAEGIQHFEIIEKDGLGGFVQASRRDVYYPVFYVAPRAGNAFAIGLDFGSEPATRHALEEAAERGTFVAIPNKAGLIDSDEPSSLIIVPVRSRASEAADRNMRGYVAALVSLRGVIHDAAPPDGPASPQIAMFDLSAPLSDRLIYSERQGEVDSDGVLRAGGTFWDIDMGAAKWRIAALPKGALEPGFTWQSALVLSGGLAITANLTGYLVALRRRRQRVEEIVRQRTGEVEEAMRQLKDTEDRLRDYVTTATDWSWEASPDLRFTTVADRASEQGIDLSRLIGLDRLTDDAAALEIEQHVEVLARRQPFKDLRYDYAVGNRQRVLSLSGLPKFGEKGEFLGYRGSARDITPQLQAEAEQRSARWAAEQANRTKSAFLANMSHEIRTPMNGVLGMVQILRDTGLNEEQRRMCEIISQSGIALLQILNDILDFSKLEAGKIELEAVDCCLTDVIGDVVSLMRHTAEPKGLSLVFEHGSIEPPWVVVDPTRFRQIVLNLVSNAIKFSQHGGIFVRLRTEKIAADRLRVSLSVADQGIGMSEAEQERLFRRFSQADISSTRRFGGTGLGLAITRELVTMMGGDISVNSTLGEGSTFTVTLDLPLAKQPGVLNSSTRESLGAGPPARLTILVAEDDEINRLVIHMMLQAQGHKVAMVENGREAIEAVETSGADLDLVLMDVMMPHIDGVTATRRIRELPPPAGCIPIIALTANAMTGDCDTYLAAGMNAYVSKPIDIRKLFTTIEQVLGVRAWNSSASEPAAAPEPKAEALSELEDFIATL